MGNGESLIGNWVLGIGNWELGICSILNTLWFAHFFTTIGT